MPGEKPSVSGHQRLGTGHQIHGNRIGPRLVNSHQCLVTSDLGIVIRVLGMVIAQDW